VTFFLEQLASWDQALIEASQALHWEPLTIVFVLLSAWWVKAPLIVAAGGLADIRARRRNPAAAVCAGSSALIAAALAGVVKELVDRVRPALADPTLGALVATPTSPSFPSGHTTTAFAAAVAVGVLHPRLRWPLVALAALVGLSRIYLGVHYTFDVLAGAALGTAIGLLVAWVVRRRWCDCSRPAQSLR
jgi:membrane-associated phospholipid phosphatase